MRDYLGKVLDFGNLTFDQWFEKQSAFASANVKDNFFVDHANNYREVFRQQFDNKTGQGRSNYIERIKKHPKLFEPSIFSIWGNSEGFKVTSDKQEGLFEDNDHLVRLMLPG